MPETRNLTDDLSEFFNEIVAVSDVSEQSIGGTRITVCVMSYHSRRSTSDSTRDSIRVRQTAIVLDEDDLDLPQFALAPHRKGIVGAIFASLVGGLDINFDDSPEFSKTYLLHGWNEQAVRALFTPAIRDYFSSRKGFGVRGQGRRFVIFLPNRVCKEPEVPQFVKESLAALALFQDSESQLDTQPELRRGTTASDVMATANRMGGLAGSMMQRQLQKIAVTREELEAFLAQNVPRQIVPPGLKRQILGDNLPLIPIGVLLAVGGSVAGVLTIMLADGMARLTGVSMLVTLPLLGGGMALVTAAYRRRKWRVLRDGKIAMGTIEKVSRTSTSVNDQVRHVATISYDDGGNVRKTSSKVYGLAAEEARNWHKRNEPVRLLVDPNDPAHVVCADLISLFD